MQFAAFRQRAAAHQLKAEGQGAGFHAGKCADLQPHAGHPTRAGLLRLLFNNFQRPLAKGDFVHGRLRIAMRLYAITMPGHIMSDEMSMTTLPDVIDMSRRQGFYKNILNQLNKIWHGKCLTVHLMQRGNRYDYLGNK
jgi:hypothetical protein